MGKQKVGIIGYTGRLGSCVVKQLELSEELEPGFHFNRSSNRPLEEIFLENDIVLDASSFSFFPEVLKAASLGKASLVIATTGWDRDLYLPVLEELAKRIPIVVAPNGSFGAVLQKYCVAILTRFLKDFDVDVLERHHRKKKEPFSGTAEDLADIICRIKTDISGNDYDVRKISGGSRDSGKIDIRSMRSGNLVGEHEVSFTGDGEMITIKHTVFDRQVFAKGFVEIISLLTQSKKTPGIYSTEDFLLVNRNMTV